MSRNAFNQIERDYAHDQAYREQVAYERQQQATCRCDAYKFPHRMDGGKCTATEDAQNLDPRPRWKILEDESGMTAKDFA